MSIFRMLSGLGGFDDDDGGMLDGYAGGAGSAPSVGPRRPGDHALSAIDKRVERLELICESMWRLLREKSGLSDEDLMAEIARLDLADGEADGRKASQGPVRCPKCDRPNSPRHDFCIYCGQLIRTSPF